MLTVCIPTYNRYDCLDETLAALARQRNCGFEVVVVDQTLGDQRRKVEMEGVDLRYFEQEQPSASAARNLALREANGEVVLFLDDDVIIDDPMFLMKHLRHYDDPKVVGVAGAAPDLGQKIRYTRHRFFRNRGLGWAYYPSNQGSQAWLRVGRSNNLSVRRDAAIACGGMDEQFEKGAHREEADFGLRLTADGDWLVYDPFASLVHIGNPEGGIRSWQQGETVKALHHMVGDLYLMRHMIPWRQRAEFLALSLRYFIFPRGLRTPPAHWMPALKRYREAWQVSARKVREGRKLISSV